LGDLYSQTTLEQIGALAESADLIGVSLMTDDYENAVGITEHLKRRRSAPIIWGGIHPTIQPRECLEHADMVCIGEGEDALVELVSKMRAGEDYRKVAGIWHKDGSEIIANPLRQLIADLDRLPFPDYGHENHYILADGEIRRLRGPLLEACLKEYYLTLTSRGCPYSCTYCWNHAYGRLFPGHGIIRKRSADNVVAELREITQAFPFIEMICIDDDAFFMRSNEEIEEFSSKYKRDIRVPLWVTGAAPSTVSRRKLDALVGAGLSALRMGIQSASADTKKLYRRTHSNRTVLEAVRLIDSYAHKIKRRQFDIILNNPWESDKDLRSTLRFLTHLPVPYELIIFPLTFYPGTDLWERAKREGLIATGGAELVRVRYHQHKQTFLNSLFFLLDECARRGIRIRPAEMALLTMPALIRSGISAWWVSKIGKRLDRAKYSVPVEGKEYVDFGQEGFSGQLGSGWYEWEQETGGSFRWTSQQCTLYLFPAGGERRLEIGGAVPDLTCYKRKKLTLKVYQGRRAICETDLATGALSFSAPLRGRPSPPAAQEFRLKLNQTFSPPHTGNGPPDIRQLGIVIQSIRLAR
jgi:radical SAM superfamily enzyme YgiQ (UPF0313 family)